MCACACVSPKMIRLIGADTQSGAEEGTVPEFWPKMVTGGRKRSFCDPVATWKMVQNATINGKYKGVPLVSASSAAQIEKYAGLVFFVLVVFFLGHGLNCGLDRIGR